MCNRYQPGELAQIRDVFGARLAREFNAGPSTVHPKDPGPVIRLVDGVPIVDQMTWGFPRIAKSKVTGKPLKPTPVNNARFDKLDSYFWRYSTSPAHRCLIPTTRYAEAVGEPGRMTETWLSVGDQPVFAWAGLWTESSEWGPVFTGVMTENAVELVDIHDRSPVILDPEDWQAWLNAPLADLYRFDRPYPAERILVDRTTAPWKR